MPVSGPFGMGEYARSLAIARAARGRWPDAEVHFVLSAQAPYAAATPFQYTLVPSSPTFHSAEVIACVHRFKPDVVIFDNAGRSAQLRAAHASGAAVIYISSRPRQRNRGFRWLWMGMLDEHWIAYPEFIAGAPGPLEKLKLALRGRPRLRFLDVILSTGIGAPPQLTDTGPFTLVVPGGGTGHPGAADAASRFYSAAKQLAAAGIKTVYVGPAVNGAAAANLQAFATLPQAELAALMRGAELIVVNGGSTLLQGIACGRACVAIAIAKDQRERIRRCVAAGAAIDAPLEADAIAAMALSVWRDGPKREALARCAADLKLRDGIEIALEGISASLRRP